MSHIGATTTTGTIDRGYNRPDEAIAIARAIAAMTARDIPGEVVGTRVHCARLEREAGTGVLALGDVPHLHHGAASHSASVVPFELREHEPRELANELDANDVEPSVPGGHTGRSAVYLASDATGQHGPARAARGARVEAKRAGVYGLRSDARNARSVPPLDRIRKSAYFF